VLPFQLEPALAVTRGVAARVLIADDVGLGKTIQAGLIVAEVVARVDDPHVLVVVPSGLRTQWREELEARFQLKPVIADSASLGRSATYFVGGENPWAMQPIVVTSIDLIKRAEVIRALETIVWDLVVFDEAHLLSTRSDRNRAATALAARARTVLMLTATPHSGDDDEFSRLCALGDLDDRFPLLMFRRTRADIGLSDSRRTSWLTVRPTLHERRMHEAVLRYGRQIWRERGMASADAQLAAMVLARRASSSASSLARSVERRLALFESVPSPEASQLALPLDDDEPGAEVGAAGLHDVSDERRQLANLLALANAARTSESKIQALRRLLRRTAEPAIVFTEYRDTLTHLQSELADRTLTTLHGGLTSSERHEALQEFTSGRARILLATDAASEGLNLHHRCRLIINLELPWTPRRREQRVGRVHRLGQTRRVHELHLVAAESYEQTVLASLARRTTRVHDALDGLRTRACEEEDVARAILGEQPIAPRAAPVAAKGVLASELSRDAVRESERVMLCRRLTPNASAEEVRPFACHIRCRSHIAAAYWAYRVTFTDPESAVLWDTVLVFGGRIPGGLFMTPSRVRHLAERLFSDCSARVENEHRAALARFLATVQEPVERAMARERAILAAAERQNARIAATLLQPSLFDRRTEATASQQTAMLEELRHRCHQRLDWLDRHQRACAGSHEPVFALIRS
jgi:superfamily II DNA or RNA helicase